MAPLKFEEHLKDKLQGREINPSKNAWSKIAAGLDNEPKKNKNKKPVYYAIAACLIGLLIASVWFFNASNSLDMQPQVVDGEKVDVNKEASSTLKKDSFKNNVETNTVVVATKKVKESKKKNMLKEEAKDILDANLHNSNEDVAITDQETKILQVETTTPEEAILDKKLNVVMEKLALLKENNIAVTNAEVDSLLRKAQQEIVVEKAMQEGMSVDAMALLLEAESELDKSFRNKIFDNLKERYLKLKTAVAARTN